jgi:hypothetical protein
MQKEMFYQLFGFPLAVKLTRKIIHHTFTT